MIDAYSTNRWALRLVTWLKVLWATRHHPFIGQGHGMLQIPLLVKSSNLPLPGPHSDWLLLAYQDGWVATVIVMCVDWTLLTRPVKSWSAKCAQIALWIVSSLALVKPIFQIPGVSTLVAVSGWLVLRDLLKPKEPSNA